MTGSVVGLAGDLGAVVRQHAAVVLVMGLTVSLLLAVWAVRRAVRGGRPDQWLARVSFLVGFAWSGEAMWEVATLKLGLSPAFAGFAFFLFESQMAVAMIRAERHQRQHSDAGRHGRAVWLIAMVAGAIAAAAGDSVVEVLLRLAVPLMVAYQWWVGLTGDRTGAPADAITWTWTVRRLLVTVGLARPGSQDLAAVDRDRHARRIAAVAFRLHSSRSTRPRRRLEGRLRRLAMDADEELLDAARGQVERAWQASERTRPLTPAEHAAVAAARASAGAARAEADLAIGAELEAQAAAETARTHAEAEATRRLQAEAEAAAAHRRAEAETTARQEAEATRAAAEANLAVASAEWQQRLAAAEAERLEQTGTVSALTAEPDRIHTGIAGRSSRTRQPAKRRDEPLTFRGKALPYVSRVAPATVLRILQARQEHPHDTQKQLADRVAISDRTIRTVLAATNRAYGVDLRVHGNVPDNGNSSAVRTS